MRSALAAVALSLVLASPALAEEGGGFAKARCDMSAGMTGWAWCQLAASFDAEAERDLRKALSLADDAARYLDEPAITARPIALREELGRRWPGYTREAVYACGQADPVVRDLVDAACRRAATRLARVSRK